MRLIGRLTDGMVTWKTAREDGGWWSCGEYYTDPDDISEKAVEIAYHVVRVTDLVDLNPWGFAGTLANESALDPCALGPGPRKWAVKNGYLPDRVRTISHRIEDVLSVVRMDSAKRRFKKTGIDLGPCQMLAKYYQGDPLDMMSIPIGIEICAREMARRGTMYRTDRPWTFWRGKKLDWYDLKVTRWARMMGAAPSEI